MRTKILLTILCCTFASVASAIDFGVMESADPVQKGFIKFEAYPLGSRATATREEDTGVNVAVGYGFWEDADLEVQLATYDDIFFAGTDVEYNFLRNERHEFSASVGGHYGNSDFGNQVGVDFTPIYSYRSQSVRGLKWNAAIDLAHDEVDVVSKRPNLDRRYLSAYAVPGVQYRLAREIDLVGEVGVGLNNDSNSYIAAGLSFYFRADPGGGSGQSAHYEEMR